MCLAIQLIEEVTRNKRLQRFKAIIAAWQRVLPEMFPAMKVCVSEPALDGPACMLLFFIQRFAIQLGCFITEDFDQHNDKVAAFPKHLA